jgi:5-(carboxyamino)imidazole ribonucleotide synthase
LNGPGESLFLAHYLQGNEFGLLDPEPLSSVRAVKETGRMGTIGIIGGGQLALMLARAAGLLGWRVRVLSEQADCPAAGCAEVVVGSWDDRAVLARLVEGCEVVTLENEFVPADVLLDLEQQGIAVLPSSACIRTVQDKLLQKRALEAAGLPVVPFLEVTGEADLERAITLFGLPLVLKRRCLGYDGTGNATLRSREDLGPALERLGGYEAGLYAEAWCAFQAELAVMITRSSTGGEVSYPVVETRQENHVCRFVLAPAEVSQDLAAEVMRIAREAVEAVGGIGSFGIELFHTNDGHVLINELAPRVHNSGHYTIEACDCSQFENHIRAVLGLPLGSPAMRKPAAAMVNLLGDRLADGRPGGLADALAVPGAHLHLYHKAQAKPGRKMGHITALGDTPKEALAIARRAADALAFDQPVS